MHILAPTYAALVGFLGSLAMAQSTILTTEVAPLARKVVVYDQGDFWPGAFVRHANDSVSALGNPWLGGKSRSLLLTGVFDMVRLDALRPGATEVVAMVGSSGLTLVRWTPATRSFELRAVVDEAAANARIVRAAPFAPLHHLIVVVPPGGTSVRCYRQFLDANGNLMCNMVATFTPTAPVLDAEVFRTAEGAARLLLRTATGVTCTDASGTLRWTAAGSGGKLARWPGSSAVRVGWVHNPAGSTGWAVTRFGDNGPIDTRDVSWAFTGSEQLVAAFAVDADHDGDVDVFVKTTSGTSLLHDQGVPEFTQLAEVSFSQLSVTSPDCVPDVVITHAGRRVRLVDEQPAGIGWSRVDVTPAGVVGGGGGPEIINLVTTTNPEGTLIGGTAAADAPHTRVGFSLHVAPTDLGPFAIGGETVTQMQVVAWSQSAPEASPEAQPEFNRLVEMQDAMTGASIASRWTFSHLLSPS